MSLMTRNTPENTSLKLERRGFHHVDAKKTGMTVVCEKGILWLTKSNDHRDYMLKPGDRMEINQRSNILIEAVSDAHVSIVYPN
jgi:hypothetical protein